MNLKKNQYCIAKIPVKARGGDDEKPRLTKEKKVLFKVVNPETSSGKVIGLIENVPHIEKQSIEVDVKQIILNLGKDPVPGQIYGFDVGSLWRDTKQHDQFGDVHFFTTPDEKDIKSLWTSMDITVKRLKAHGLQDVLRLPCVYEVIPQKGKYAGMYRHPRNEKVPGRIQISIGQDVLEKASIGNYTYVLTHEVGHLVHDQCLANYPKLNSQWVQLYLSTIAPRVVNSARCIELGADILKSSAGDLRGYISESDEDTQAELKLILKWVREMHSVTAKELNLLLGADTKSARLAFKDTWPKVDVQSKDLKPTISQYSCKSYHETFAETFAFYLADKKLPQDAKDLIEKSIGLARGYLKTHFS